MFALFVTRGNVKPEAWMRKRKAQDQLEVFLMEGIESGEPTEMTRQDWDDIRREGRKLSGTRKRQKTA